MSLAWGARLSGGSLAWGARTASATEGVISGSAQVSAFVEHDLALTWQLNGGVTSDLSLLWQLNASPITAVESDLQLTWNVITTAGTYVEADLSLLWQRGGSVQSNLYLTWQVGPVLDVAGASAVRRAPIRHPGWSRKQAQDVLARDRAMDRSIREALNPSPPPVAIKVKPPQRTSAQMAAEMASAERAAVAKRRAVEAGMEAQRARVEIERLQPELAARRQQASFRVIEQLLGNL